MYSVFAVKTKRFKVTLFEIGLGLTFDYWLRREGKDESKVMT